MKTTIIVNPVSGNINSPNQLHQLEESIYKDGRPIDMLVTGAPGEATELTRRAIERGSELIIAVSGDGTINEVINGMAGGGATLGIIPAGVSNVLALELGIPRSWRDAVRVIQDGHPRRIDLGLVNGRYFSLMVGVGFDAQAVKLANPSIKRYLKRYAYHLAGARALFFYRPKQFQVQVEGKDLYPSHAVIVSNAHYYGGSHQITPEARIDDGYLRLCIFEKGKRRDYLRYFYGVIAGHLYGYPDVRSIKCRSLEIDQPGYPLHADGDFIGYTPVKVTIKPHCLSVMVP